MQTKEISIAAGYGPGKTLGQARADLKLSQDEVALQLHLAPRQIIALENDDYDNLPQPTYVRGYLRSYALLLGLNPEPILESYAQLLPARKPPAAQKVTVSVDQEMSGKEPHIKLAGYVVAALVIGLAVAWWQSYEPASTTPDENASVSAPAAEAEEEALLTPSSEEEDVSRGALSEALPKADSLTPLPLTARAPGAELPAAAPATRPAPAVPPVSTAPVAATPAAPVAPKPVAPASRQTEPVAPTPAAPAATTPAEAVVSPSVASAAAPATPASGATASVSRAQVVLRTEQESWAEVRDAHDTRLLYESVPAGRTVKIEGEAPLSVFLGNADAVKVEYNGRPYDTSRHKRGLVARFTLGAGSQAPAPAADAPSP